MSLRKASTSTLLLSLVLSPVVAHDPGLQSLGSGVWKYVFFFALLVFAGSAINWLIHLLRVSDTIKQTLTRVVRGACVGVGGFFIYHRFIE